MFLTLYLPLPDQLDAVHKAFKSARLLSKGMGIEPPLREKLMDLREELLGKGHCFWLAICAKRFRPTDFFATKPGYEDPIREHSFA